jgi:hypothetical protein
MMLGKQIGFLYFNHPKYLSTVNKQTKGEMQMLVQLHVGHISTLGTQKKQNPRVYFCRKVTILANS